MTDAISPARFTRDGWSVAGYSGFRPLLQLDLDRVPTGGGVYAVIRPSADPPTFLVKSRGGRFKGQDPTVEIATLESNWVRRAETLNIGKADVLRRRLGEYRDFGNGKPIGHRGGRYIWQLADADELVVCWSVTTDNPRDVEHRLIAEFVAAYGCRPFANLRD